MTGYGSGALITGGVLSVFSTILFFVAMALHSDAALAAAIVLAACAMLALLPAATATEHCLLFSRALLIRHPVLVAYVGAIVAPLLAISIFF